MIDFQPESIDRKGKSMSRVVFGIDLAKNALLLFAG